jgi:hypothetical protein
MIVSAREARKLALPAIACAVLIGAGAALIGLVDSKLTAAQQALTAAKTQHADARERLMRIADEEREVNEKLAVYRRLQQLHIIGPERRLEWADAMSRIKAARELLDLRYRVDRQQPLITVPGKPGNVEFYSSTMTVDLALLHTGDLLGFLDDLRNSGNAYYSVRSCTVTRTGQAPTGTTIVARLRAQCVIDLITILDRAART